MKKLGNAILWHAILLFTIPWFYWTYNIIEIVRFRGFNFNIITSQTINYIRHPFVLVFTLVALVCLISSVGILKSKNWGRVVGICIMSLIALFSFGFNVFSSYCLYVSLSGGSGGMASMVEGIFGFIIGPLVFILILLPSLLFLYFLTRPHHKRAV